MSIIGERTPYSLLLHWRSTSHRSSVIKMLWWAFWFRIYSCSSSYNARADHVWTNIGYEHLWPTYTYCSQSPSFYFHQMKDFIFKWTGRRKCSKSLNRRTTHHHNCHWASLMRREMINRDAKIAMALQLGPCATAYTSVYSHGGHNENQWGLQSGSLVIYLLQISRNFILFENGQSTIWRTTVPWS